MHTLQYIATQADDIDHAFRSVRHYLEAQLGDGDSYNTWYDWFVTGGGRWSTNSEANQYNDEWQGDVAHQSDPRFQEYLDTAHKYRLEILDSLLEDARKIKLSEILDSFEDFEHDLFRVSMDLYPLTKLYDMATARWDFNSYFFDIVHDSTNRKYMLESIDKGANDWYLVPVDFHF